MAKKVLFIDRDGTIMPEPHDEQIDSFEKMKFLPGAISNLGKIAKELDYELVLVTNQDGLGTSSFPEETFWPVQNLMLSILASEGVIFNEICIDKSFPHENLPTRKPGIGMLQKYVHGNYDLANSFVLGDRLTDIELAKNLGAKAIFIGQPQPDVALSTQSWSEIYQFLKGEPRTANVQRKTSETTITIDINLEGNGTSQIETGIAFFDHMLTQIARHGNLDLNINVKGDLEVDEHHTIEDTALALGEAFRLALGSKKGIERYGFTLPMDDCLAQVALDFGGRPWLVWEADFKREKVGEMPTEMLFHFFKSFSDAALCNLNIKAEGNNEHHKIESIFKAFAKAIKQAKTQTDSGSIPSSKGTL
ncbi:MAG: bifunctional histidinol-phosphatase/imidazoleglycerol-phosphate dehydratase HisB [Luteibaculaceae bacterium]